MQWKCPTSTAEDWDNVPEMAVQVIFYLEKHCKSIVELLKNWSHNESTYALRQELTSRFTVSSFFILYCQENEGKFSSFSESTENSITQLGSKDQDIETQLQNFVREIRELISVWTIKSVQQDIEELFIEENQVQEDEINDE